MVEKATVVPTFESAALNSAALGKLYTGLTPSITNNPTPPALISATKDCNALTLPPRT